MNCKQTVWMMIVISIAIAARANDCEREYRDVYAMKDAAVIALLEEKIPLLAEEINDLRQADDEDYDDVMEEGRDLLEEYYETMEDSPELARLFLKTEVMNTEADQLADRFHDSEEDAERARIKASLKAKLSQIFDLQLEARMLEVKLMTEEIAEIKETVEKRQANKDRILERHMREELEEEDELLEWW